MFDKFISLGWFCGTAASMSKHGLRGMSGPFDWSFSELSGLLELINTDFNDFMKKENLQVSKDNPRVIKDIKYNITFNHAIKDNFELEYNAIYKKYTYRAERLKKYLKSGEKICFIRAIQNLKELYYIVDNEKYINDVISKYNKENKILFLIPQYMATPKNINFEYFILNINCYQGNSRIALRNMFDTNPKLTDWLNSSINDKYKKDNLIFDLRAENRKLENGYLGINTEKTLIKDIDNAYKQIHMHESRCERLIKIARADFEKIKFDKDIAIYGAGDIGKIFFNKIKKNNNVECFLDIRPVEKNYGGVPILLPTEINLLNCSVVIVIPTYDFEKISSDLRKNSNRNIVILSLEEVLDNNIS